MATNEVLNIIRNIPGSWRLPIKESSSVIITFYPNGHFFWVVSANSVLEKAKQIAVGSDMQGNWQVRSEPGSRGSIRGSSAVVRGSSVALSQMFGSSTPMKVEFPPGPYLILNFTELPKSVLNVTAFGLRLDLANWTNNFLETMRDGNHRILEFNPDKMRLENPKKKQEVWFRATISVVQEG